MPSVRYIALGELTSVNRWKLRNPEKGHSRRMDERTVIGYGTLIKAESGFESFGWDSLGGNPVHRNADHELRVIK
jgi:hypothetical protein